MQRWELSQARFRLASLTWRLPTGPCGIKVAEALGGVEVCATWGPATGSHVAASLIHGGSWRSNCCAILSKGSWVMR